MNNSCTLPITIRINGIPAGRARHRTGIQWPKASYLFALIRSSQTAAELLGKLKATLRTRAYQPTDGADQAFMDAIRLSAQQLWRGPLLERPIALDIWLQFPRHQARIWNTKDMPPYWHTEKPDVDNVEKAIMDALTGTVWLDDAMVCEKHVYARRSPGNQMPQTIIVVRDPRPEALEDWAMKQKGE